MLEDRFVGSVLSLALGDALGAPLEGGLLETGLWALIGRTRDGKRRFTDDTQMSLDLGESLVACQALVPDDVAARFAQSYAWSRGYGHGAAKVLKAIRRGVPWQEANRSVFPEGSFGNGGAMRAAVVGLFFAGRPDDLAGAIAAATRITHEHPLALDGARLIAKAVARALVSSAPLDVFDYAAGGCTQPQHARRLSQARSWLHASAAVSAEEVAAQLGNGVLATESCVTALYIALRCLERPFPELLELVAQCGGDVDTIGAMAGGIWGAANGRSRIPDALLEQLEQRQRLEQLGSALFHTSRAVI